jgi:cell division protein ZapA
MSTTKPDGQSKASESKAITISVMGRDFRVATSSAGEKHMLEAVEYLNQRMKEVRDTGKVVGGERIAIMAALNITLEHFTKLSTAAAPQVISNVALLRGAVDESAVKRRIENLDNMIERAISDQDKLF